MYLVWYVGYIMLVSRVKTLNALDPKFAVYFVLVSCS